MLRHGDWVLARHDSLDLGGGLRNRCERLCDAILHDECDDCNRQDDGSRNEGDDCATREYDDDSYDNLSMCSDDNSEDSDSNTKLNDKRRR